jgi:hypothetical protein
LQNAPTDRRHPGKASLIRDNIRLKRLPFCDSGSRFAWPE